MSRNQWTLAEILQSTLPQTLFGAVLKCTLSTMFSLKLGTKHFMFMWLMIMKEVNMFMWLMIMKEVDMFRWLMIMNKGRYVHVVDDHEIAT